MSARSHYELLGVPKDATTAQIKAAYRKLARTTHPDTGGDGALFALITEAYNTLVDPASRDAYDRQLSGSYAGAGAGSSTGSARTTTASGGGGGFAGSRRAQEVWEAHARARAEMDEAARKLREEREQARREAEKTAAEQQRRLAALAAAREAATRRPWKAWLLIGFVLFLAVIVRDTNLLGWLLGRGELLETWGFSDEVKFLIRVPERFGFSLAVALPFAWAYWERAKAGPIGLVERYLMLWTLLIGWSSWDLWPWQGWAVAAAVLAAWAGWYYVMVKAPDPTTAAQWSSFTLYRRTLWATRSQWMPIWLPRLSRLLRV